MTKLSDKVRELLAVAVDERISAWSDAHLAAILADVEVLEAQLADARDERDIYLAAYRNAKIEAYEDARRLCWLRDYGHLPRAGDDIADDLAAAIDALKAGEDK